MESLSLCITSFSPIFKPHKFTPIIPPNSLQIPISITSNNFHANKVSTFMHFLTSKTSLKPHFYLPIIMGIFPSSSSLASEFADPTSTSPQLPQRINLESILVSIDDFFNRYPYFVTVVAFIWLIGIPLGQEYLRKYKFITALNAFKKLRDDSSVQMLDIRDKKSLAFLGSPNLRMFNKNVAQVAFDEGDEDGFLKKVLEKLADPNNTSVCIVDNFDGNSMKVAELLVKNGYKEAYAVKGGVSGKNGWREIQQEFFPPSVHVYPKKKAKKSQGESNGAAIQPDADQVQAASSEK